MFKIKYFGATYKNHRFNNEDNYCIEGHYAEQNHEDTVFSGAFNDKRRHVLGVFDGLGGEDKGEVASYYAAKDLAGFKAKGEIEDFYTQANNKILSLKDKNSSKVVGTTAVLMDIGRGAFVCSNIGDSRAYIIRADEIRQLSHDHTSMQMLIDTGFITRDELAKSSFGDALSQFLGIDEPELAISPYIAQEEAMQDGDILLLCSDGLTGHLTPEEIMDTILSTSPKEIAATLYDMAEKRGAKDNITMIILYIEEKRGFWGF